MRKNSRTEQQDRERDEEPGETPRPQPQADGSPRPEMPGADRDADARRGAGTPDVIETEDEDEDDASRLPVAESANVRNELEEQRDKYLRLAAEFDNFRKRTLRERQEAGSRAQADIVRQLLDAFDDLGRVTSLDPATTETRAVIEGVEMVERKLFKALGAAGLEVVSPVDETFNPELHEAVSTTPAISPEDDSLVAMVYQPGYVFRGQLIRPARVVVKQWNG